MTKGYLLSAPEKTRSGVTAMLPPWEALAIDAVGSVIEFWGFKLNHGRVWALLFLRGIPMTALEIQNTLNLSKGGVSMVTRELEQWNVIHRVRSLQESSWRFEADTDFKSMISRVIASREASFLARVTRDLQEAEKRARDSETASKEVLLRLRRMRLLAEAVSLAVDSFIATARFDVRALGTILVGGMSVKGKS